MSDLKLFRIDGGRASELFLRSTGLSLPSYRKLTELGVIDVGNMTDAIQKFRYFEKQSIEGTVRGERG